MSQRKPTQLSAEISQALARFKSTRVYAAGYPLFLQGSPARGMYVIESGEVRLLLPANPKSKQVFLTVGPGTLLGLSESVCGENHKLTAEAACPTHVSFIPRKRLLEALRRDPGYCWRIVQLLSEDLHGLYHHVVRANGAGRLSAAARPPA
jgi:CRP-like cAMP-binding protein